MSDLGPVTERRFAEAFAAGAVITAKAAAELIGLDVKTLDAFKAAAIHFTKDPYFYGGRPH